MRASGLIHAGTSYTGVMPAAMTQKGAAVMTKRIAIAIVSVVLLGSCATALAAGNKAPVKGKKLYCWNQGGQKICGDALPPEAAGSARTEISARTGLQTGEVARMPNAEERAAAATVQEQAEAQAAAESARQRRDLAMVESYDSETDLRRAYGERIALVELALKASALGEANLRNSLVALLQQANDTELAGKPVAPALLANIRTQHAQLQSQLRIIAQQRSDRAALDGELAGAVERYRALKQPQG